MSRTFSFICTIFAIIIVLLMIQFVSNYYLLIQLSLANMLTKIFFWSAIFIGGFFVVGLLFFKQWIYKKRKQLFLSFCVLLFGIVSIEIMLRIIDNKPLRFSPHPYLNYVGTPNYQSQNGLNIHNSLGFRGPEIQMPKPKEAIRIALLGGSTTYEDFVKDWRKDWARRLEYYLNRSYPNRNIEVINAGLPGWSSWEDLINLQFRLIDLNLDLIIVYEGTNEIHPRFVNPVAYKADNTGYVKQWERKPCFDLMCFKIAQSITGLDAYGFDISAPTVAQFPKSDDYNSILGMTPTEALAKNSPIYSERNLRNIIAVARENNIDVLLATWAWNNQLSDYAATSHYQQGFREQNNMVKKVASSKNVPLYDFASEMPMDKKYWGDGRHNNEEGVDLKSKLFADFIFENKLLEEKDQKQNP